MDEFDFTDGLKIVLVSVFLIGSVQLHAVIDESDEHAADHAAGRAAPVTQAPRQGSDLPQGLAEGAARTLPFRT